MSKNVLVGLIGFLGWSLGAFGIGWDGTGQLKIKSWASLVDVGWVEPSHKGSKKIVFNTKLNERGEEIPHSFTLEETGLGHRCDADSQGSNGVQWNRFIIESVHENNCGGILYVAREENFGRSPSFQTRELELLDHSKGFCQKDNMGRWEVSIRTANAGEVNYWGIEQPVVQVQAIPPIGCF